MELTCIAGPVSFLFFDSLVAASNPLRRTLPLSPDHASTEAHDETDGQNSFGLTILILPEAETRLAASRSSNGSKLLTGKAVTSAKSTSLSSHKLSVEYAHSHSGSGEDDDSVTAASTANRSADTTVGGLLGDLAVSRRQQSVNGVPGIDALENPRSTKLNEKRAAGPARPGITHANDVSKGRRDGVAAKQGPGDERGTSLSQERVQSPRRAQVSSAKPAVTFVRRRADDHLDPASVSQASQSRIAEPVSPSDIARAPTDKEHFHSRSTCRPNAMRAQL